MFIPSVSAAVQQLFKKMPTTAQCNKLFSRYKALLNKLNEAIDTFEDTIELAENRYNFKEYEDVAYLAKHEDVW